MNDNTSNNFSASNSSASGVQLDLNMMPKKRASRSKAHLKSDNAVGERDTTRRGGKGNIGKLAWLLDLPLDCLLEIFGHMMPTDLLHLSRATKAFRAVLLHRSSVSVWKSSLSNVPGLPPCPPDLIEPQWVNLVFGKNCMACLAVAGKPVDIAWHIRMRLCPDCWNTHVAPTPPDDDEIFTDMVPNYTGPNYDIFKAMYFSLEGEAREAFVVEAKKNTELIFEHYQLCLAWVRSQAETRAQELKEIREARKDAIVERLTALGYGPEIEEDYAFSAHPLVKQSKPLTERVWKNIQAQMIVHMEEVKARRLARELRELETERSFALRLRKNILIRKLRQFKQTRNPSRDVMPEPFDFCEYPPVKALIREGLHRNDLRDVVYIDFGSLMRTFIQEWRGELDEALVWTALKCWTNSAAGIEPTLPLDSDSDSDSNSNSSSDSYPEGQKEDQDEMDVDASPSPPSPNYTPLDISMASHAVKLAAFVWRCMKCTKQFDMPSGRRPLFYPKVLAHGCLTGKTAEKMIPRVDRGYTKYDDDIARRLENYKGHRKSWNCELLCVDTQASAWAKKIVKAVGLDPYTTTADEMDALDARLGCLGCTNLLDGGSIEVQTYGWRSAVQHQAERHSLFDGILWRLLTPSERASAIAYEKYYTGHLTARGSAFRLSNMPSDSIVWLCSRCADTPQEHPPMELIGLFDHMKTVHGIDTPIPNQDYFKDFAAPQLYFSDTLPQVGKIFLAPPVEPPAPDSMMYIPQVLHDYYAHPSDVYHDHN